MDSGILLIQFMNGLAYSLLLFLLAAGLSLIFGMMDVMNLTHGSFYMLGAYIALSVVATTHNFWVAVIVVPVVIGVIGVLLELSFLRPLYRRGHLDQVLLTFGFAFVFSDIRRALWGSNPLSLAPPPLLSQSLPILGRVFPSYRLFVIVLGLVLAVGLWLFVERTRLGAIVRAGVSDREMVAGLGINITLVFSLVFAFGALLAGLSGVIAAPISGLSPGMDFEVLMIALLVVVVGGLGTLKGAFWGALLIGEVQSLGQIYFPQAALALIFLVMAVVLLAKPSGLFGRELA